MRRATVLFACWVLVVAACGTSESTTTTTASPSAPTATAPSESTAPPSTATTTRPPTTTATTTTLPGPPDAGEMEALAWGLFCRDLESVGRSYTEAVAYWNAEGRPARMDADENGIPCETVYQDDAVRTYWGDPLPTDLSPGPGSGWFASSRESPATPGCCSMNTNAPTSPPLPPADGGFPQDGAYSVALTRDMGSREVQMTIRRWLPCDRAPEYCSPDLFPGDVYSDPNSGAVRTLVLDDTVTVVVKPIPTERDGVWELDPIEASGIDFAHLLHRLDVAYDEVVLPAMDASADVGGLSGDFLVEGGDDPTFPFGPTAMGGDDEDYVSSLLSYRGPDGARLTPGLYAVLEWDQGNWMYGWWCTLEIVDGAPVLYVFAGQIAG